MKLTIEGSAKELVGIMGMLKSNTGNAELPPLLTKLADTTPNAGKENAPQGEAAEQKKKQDFFEKQMDLLSQASKDCLLDISLYQHLPALTQAMIELHQCICRDR